MIASMAARDDDMDDDPMEGEASHAGSIAPSEPVAADISSYGEREPLLLQPVALPLRICFTACRIRAF